MSTFNNSHRLLIVVVMIALLTCVNVALADKLPVFTGGGDFAIRGYDTVAYHLEGKPVKGVNEFTAHWNDTNWRFVSAENRDMFLSDPERWAPAYGGYCAWAVANNYTAKTEPDAWSIVNERLFLNFNKSVRRTWGEDIPGNIKRGDANWPAVLSK